MADPVSISFSLQDLKCTVQSLKYYQQMSGNAQTLPLLTSLWATLQANVSAASPPMGLQDALAGAEQT